MSAKFPQEGSMVLRNTSAKLDYSHINEGYFIVWVYDPGPHRKFKIKVSANGKEQNFSAHPEHGEVYVPLVYGSGRYTLIIARHTSGVSYEPVINTTMDVRLPDELEPWLYPTAYAEYFQDSVCVRTAEGITAGLTADIDKLGAIVEYVMDCLEYDTELARTVNEDKTKFWIPTPDDVIAKKKGICWEYASLTAALCRVSGIPCKVVVGWVGGIYHAWNEIWMKDGGSLIDGYPMPESQWALLDLTVADSGGGIKTFYDYAANNAYAAEYYG